MPSIAGFLIPEDILLPVPDEWALRLDRGEDVLLPRPKRARFRAGMRRSFGDGQPSSSVYRRTWLGPSAAAADNAAIALLNRVSSLSALAG